MNHHFSRLRMIAAVALAIISLAAASVFAQQNPRELFERARMLDESNQNLGEAIKLYSQVVSQSTEQRSLAARAQYRIGVLYERLGRKAEAQKAFQAVVSHYADQTEVTQRARAKLPAAAVKNEKGRMRSIASTGPAATGISVRQVWAGPNVDFFGMPTTDGRHLPVTDWETGDVGIRDLENGQTRRLTNKGSWMQSTEFAIFPTLSPDGKQLAYAWFNKEMTWELRIVGTEGSAPRMLYQATKPDTADGDFAIPVGWMPDGKNLAVGILKKDNSDMALMSVANGSLRVLKTFPRPGGGESIGRLSPDGRYIAYDGWPKPDAKENDIFIFDVETRQEVPVIQHPANDVMPVWTLDGRNILFVSDRTGTNGFWLQSIVDGKPKGAPQLVKPDAGRVSPMGFTRNGSLYYGLDTGMNDVYSAGLDLKAGKVVEAPAPISQRFVGSNSAPTFSPDGKYLVYVSMRGTGTAHPNTRSREKVLVIRSLETGQERDVAVNLTTINRPQWWPDGRSILAVGQDRQGNPGIYRIDVQTGAATVIAREEGNNYRWPTLSPDGRTLFYLQINSPKKTWSIRAHDLQDGGVREIYSVSPPANTILTMGLSPDGQHLAFILSDVTKPQHVALKVMPAGGVEAREICLIPANVPGNVPGNTRLLWTPDGQRILFTVRSAQEPAKPPAQTFELWQVSAAGGEPQKVGLAMERLRDLSLHPDGKRLAFAAGQSKPEVWVMENFLPAAQMRKTSVSRR